jgi:LysR family transcriptional regulator, regulator of abg operon
MKLHHFREVVAIVEQGSIRAAARVLRVAQPVLTRSLADLEREIGAPLFERRARGVVPTPLGQAFAGRAILIQNEMRQLRDEMDQLRGSTTGTVTAGLSIAAHLALLPATLTPFRQRYRDTRLHIIEGFYPTLEAGLRSGSVDFYVGPSPGKRLAPELSQEVLFPNRRTILCRKGHPLAGARTLRDLADADWATTSITVDAEDEIGGIFQRHKLAAPRLAIRSQSALTLMVCLLNSDLLAMAPVQWSEFTTAGGALATIQVMEELEAPAIVMIKRADLPLTPAAIHLLDLMRRVQTRMT